MKKRTILFVEDNLAILENTLEILELDGYDVLGADNGEKGVQMAFEHLPDLIISDIQIPIIDGYEVLNLVKKKPIHCRHSFCFSLCQCAAGRYREGQNVRRHSLPYQAHPCC